jgi:formate hydrogenlyase subunit 6/NADH:ubiquinone oxidoreductase subunit I
MDIHALPAGLQTAARLLDQWAVETTTPEPNRLDVRIDATDLLAAAKGMVKAMIHRPVTQRYPFERLAAPERFRSKLQWNLNECTGCGLCVKDCPANAIDVVTLDRKAKRFVFRYHVDRCTFCGQCVATCNKHCLSMPQDDWELAALNRDEFVVFYGNEADVQSVLAGSTDPDAATSAAP